MKIVKYLLIVAASFSFIIAAASDTALVSRPAQNVPEVPGYDISCSDGLYATISGFLQIKGINVRGEQSLNLNVPGFCKTLPVRAVI